GAAPADPALFQAGRELLAARVHALARRRALLRLRSNAPTGVAWLGERKLGVAAWMTVKVPPGRANLSVQAEGYRPYQQELALAPGEARELVATLQRSSAAAAPGVSRAALRSTPSLFSRPALYTGAAGLLAAVVGLAVGQQASDVGSRAKDADGNGVLDVTMREVSAARSHARLANALLVAGGGLAGASALYLVLEPGAGPARGPVEPAGVRLVTGGEF
ncbi:MAG TPA: PEGA domain-containing protein, partial [Aggregicoccus sp.]|nr:PEGA domain-containing protein [Aggregicoccus sp.]